MSNAVAAPSKANGFGAQSAALLANTALNGVLGIAFWLLAGRLASTSDVALAIAASSLVILLSFLTQMNLGTALSRFLGGAGAGKRALVAYSYAASLLCCVVVGAGLALIAWAQGGELLRGADWGYVLLIIAAVPLWNAFALQDNVLVAMRRAHWIPFENTAAAILRLALLPLLSGAGASGLFLAFMLPAVPAVIVVSFLFVRQLPAVEGWRENSGHRKMLSFALVDLPGVLAAAAALRIVPILVLELRGTDDAAFVGLPWTVLTVALLALSALSLALLAELAIPDIDHTAVLRRARRLITALIPLCVVAALLVEPVLSLAGPKYASNGSPVLIGGVLALVPAAATEIKIAQLRFAGRVSAAAAAQFSRAIPLVAVAAILAATDHLALLGAALVAANCLSWLCAHWLIGRPAIGRQSVSQGQLSPSAQIAQAAQPLDGAI